VHLLLLHVLLQLVGLLALLLPGLGFVLLHIPAQLVLALLLLISPLLLLPLLFVLLLSTLWRRLGQGALPPLIHPSLMPLLSIEPVDHRFIHREDLSAEVPEPLALDHCSVSVCCCLVSPLDLLCYLRDHILKVK
jgi:hypothetical protein